MELVGYYEKFYQANFRDFCFRRREEVFKLEVASSRRTFRREKHVRQVFKDIMDLRDAAGTVVANRWTRNRSAGAGMPDCVARILDMCQKLLRLRVDRMA
jgi:hypothetical protein